MTLPITSPTVTPTPSATSSSTSSPTVFSGSGSAPAPVSRHALVLGLLTTVGPFAVDMYLPVLPALGHSLDADTHAVQASLMAFFLALGGGQLVSGPLSDMLGRKRPMLAGLVIFILASMGCALAPDIQTLIALRFVQGLGACACMVTPRAVVRDLYTGADAARLMSLLLVVYSVSPILAPLVGSLVAEVAGWRGVFWTLALMALAAIALVVLGLPETRPPEARLHSSFKSAMQAYGVVLRDRHFLGLALMASLTLSAFFIYVANSPFVLSMHYGVPPRQYALLFALNAVALIVVSRLQGWLNTRFGLRRVLHLAIMGQVLSMLLLMVLTAAGVDRLGVMVALLLVSYGLNGVVVPAIFMLAMERHAAHAGTASALIGTLNFAGGGLAVALTAPFMNSTPLPMIASITACAIAVFGLARLTLRAA